MNLPIFSKNQETKQKSYLALIISDTKLGAALWRAGEAGVEIIETSPHQDYQGNKQLTVKADQVLQKLGPESEKINEVVLGLAPNWTDQDGILLIKKPILKELTEELGLKPVGFVVTSEALAKHLGQQNGRLSCLLVELGLHHLTLSYLQQGKLLISKEVGRSDQTLADMAEGLARLNAHYEDQHQEQLYFPPKILVASFELSQEELLKEQQILIDHDWVNSHPFNHMPTVDLLKAEAFLEAVVLQGGRSVAAAAGMSVGVQTMTQKSVFPKNQAIAPQKKEKALTPELKAESEAEPPKEEVNEAVDANVSSSSFGIPLKLEQLPVSNKSVATESEEESFKAERAVDFKESRDQTKINNQKVFSTDFQSQSTKSKIGVNQQKKKKQGLFMKIFTWFKHNRAFAIGGFVAGLLTLTGLSYWWLSTNTLAYVELDLVTKPVSQETSLILDDQRSSSDPENLILAASKVEQKVEGQKTKESTGTKLVGEEATGTVTIFNKTEAAKTFEAGTSLSKGNLNFTLDEKVEVASASVETSASGENKEYGQADVSITAVEIGAESNLEKEAELQLDNFDLGTYAAIVKDGLSGGSSREVRVVSEADQEELFADLESELTQKAEDEMRSALEVEERLVPTGDYTIVKENYSAEVGDEVNSFDLSLELLVEALSYHQQNLVPLAQAVLAADVPENYSLDNSDPQILSDPVQDATQAGRIKLNVNLSAEAQPKIELEQLKEELAGRRLSEAIQTLEAKDIISQAKISLQPRIAKTLRPRLPKNLDKIEVN